MDYYFKLLFVWGLGFLIFYFDTKRSDINQVYGCSKCDSEYEPHIEKCYDCGEILQQFKSSI